MNFLNILSGIFNILIIILIATYKAWSPKLFQYVYDKKIIKYKTDLETEKEKQLAEYSKSITGFNKFFNKKYEIYPELYSKVIKLHGELSNWAPSQFHPDFKKLTTEEFNDYLNTFDFSIPDKRELLSLRDTEKFNDWDFFKLLPGHFRVCIRNTNNFFQENRLFLSKEIELLFSKVLDNANKIWSGYHSVFGSTEHDDKWEEIISLNKKNNEIILELLNQMRSELEHELIYKDSVIYDGKSDS
jgi:hypothetical protein